MQDFLTQKRKSQNSFKKSIRACCGPGPRPAGAACGTGGCAPGRSSRPRVSWRSEEHTSELQSQSNLVCRLLLEKKKKKAQKQTSVGQLKSICTCMTCSHGV